MLEVEIDKILPVTEARDNFNKLVDEVESSDSLYVLTKNGKPCAVLVGVHHLEKLTGTSHEELMGAAAGAVSEELDKEEIEPDALPPEEEKLETEADQTPTPSPTTNVDLDPVDATPTIDLTNFPSDDVTNNDPDPIAGNEPITESNPPVAAPAPAAATSQVIPGITNVASDPTLSTSPFEAKESPSQAVIGQRGFQDQVQTNNQTEPAVAPTSSISEDASLEDPLDFLSEIDETQNQPANSGSASSTPITPAPAINPAAGAFSDISEGANGANTPDEIVAPTQGAFAEQPTAAQTPASSAIPPQQSVQNQ